MRCRQAGAGRRSGALSGARVDALDGRLGCGRQCPQHRLPNAVPYTAQPRQATSLLAPVTAPERHIRANICTCSGARFGPVKDTPNAETA
jgi:hypothetical protein